MISGHFNEYECLSEVEITQTVEKNDKNSNFDCVRNWKNSISAENSLYSFTQREPKFGHVSSIKVACFIVQLRFSSFFVFHHICATCKRSATSICHFES
jgi:hypothetical protein